MSTIKKMLALVLALTMVLSVSAVAGYTVAPYGDAAGIDANAEEAVQLLYSLNIMKGDDKGNFNPNATITRAEVAKMVYVIMNYGKDDKAVNYTGAKIFSDVTGDWYEGYVNFCGFTKLVQGRPDGTFGPNDPVTCAEAAKMLLTAIGYSAEGRGYIGAGWDKQVLQDASIIGLLDGYNYNTSTFAPRQWAAVMFKNALTGAYTYSTIAPVVFSGLLTGHNLPTDANITMGEKYLGLYEFEGVITANEWADLYGSEGLSAGKTRIGDKVFNISTDLDDIGENRWGYAVKSDVMYIKDSGNTTWDNDGATTTIKASKVDMDSLKGAQYFTNFEGGSDVYDCDYRLSYKLDLTYSVTYGAGEDDEYETEADAKEAVEEWFEGYGFDVTATASAGVATYTKTDIARNIKAGGDITATDLALIELVFVYGDDAEDANITVDNHGVYVGTQVSDDASDDMTYAAFYNKYINDGTLYEAIDSVENGEWLKVIDNDGDGDAEYVFVVTTDMAEITNISKKASRYTFSNGMSNIKSSVIETKDELAKGDIVLITVIDGVYYVDLAEVKTETIDKRGIDFKNETLTCGDNIYSWSGINEYTDVTYDELDELYAGDEYDMYFDRFGFVRVAEYPGFNRGFVLLVDGYYETDNRSEQYKAEIFNVETDEFEDVNVLSSSSKYDEEDFISDDITYGDKDWGRLVKFDTGFWTNMAAYAINEDGEYALYDVEGSAVNGIAGYYEAVEIDAIKSNGKAIAVSTKELTDVAGNDIHVTSKTQYYLVTKNAYGVKAVSEWVGYANAPEGTALNAVDLKAYAITHEAEDMTEDVADVVIFESKAAVTDDLGLVFALDQIRNGSIDASYKAFDAYYLAYDAEAEAYANVSAELDPTYGTIEIDELSELLQYALIDSDGNMIVVDEDFADYYIFAGIAADDAEVMDNDYVYVDEASGEEYSFKPADVQNFIVVEDSSKTSVRTRYDIIENEEGYEYGDELIFVTNSKGTILYVINVAESYDEETYTAYSKATYGVDALDELFATIVDDATEITNVLYTVTVKGATATLTGGKGTEAAPYTYVAAAADITDVAGVETLEVVAKSTATEVVISRGDGLTFTSTNGVATDEYEGTGVLTAPATAYAWTVVAGGVYYTVTIQ